MRSLFRSAAIASTLLFDGVAWSQENVRPAEPSEVVVTGVRNTDREVREFVGTLTTKGGDRQLSRFETRDVCPAAIGLAPAQKAAVVARLRAVAKAAGVPLAKDSCRPNVMVVITRDKKALLQSLSRDGGEYFGSLTSGEVRRLIDDPSPAVAWHLGGTLNADGIEMQRSGDDQVAVNRTGNAGSRITRPSRPHLAAAAVVIQADALVGLTTTQLADYAAMRVFARTDPTLLPERTAPTILKVLDAAMDSQTPVTLTNWDLGLLKGLYGSAANLSAASQRSLVAGSVSKEARAQATNDE